MRLEEYLKSRGLSQTEFAELLGASDTVISRIVRGSRTPSARILARIEQETQGAVGPSDFDWPEHTIPHPSLRPDVASLAIDATGPRKSLYLADETALVDQLIDQASLSAQERTRTDVTARRLVEAVRAGRRRFGGVDQFMQEYALSSEEGIVLMCLAEALLRIPDAGTADKLIKDKIGSGNWRKHIGHSESFLVNASTWGLMLTGKVVGLNSRHVGDVGDYLGRLVARSGEPVIRQAVTHAMRVLGRQFVLGRTIEEAMRNAASVEARGYRHSYDMLGEAARTMEDADRYFDAYDHAIISLGKTSKGDDIFSRPSISVKLSALHPRYEDPHLERLRTELIPRLVQLSKAARENNIALTVDAEEQDRLDLSLKLIHAASECPELKSWDGFGLAVQAYGKRALPVLHQLQLAADKSKRRWPVRLVKGAYWDTEIKRAQVEGLSGYPVFTRKEATDVSYLACARYLLENVGAFYPQFATHNAHTLAAVSAIAAGLGRNDGRYFEFQRLHGMGESLYEAVDSNIPCRIYAPVGTHENLLAYLVRRLLENGANTSFVNRLADDEAPISEIVADPVEMLAAQKEKPHPAIPLPTDLYQPERINSEGFLITDADVAGQKLAEMGYAIDPPEKAGALIAGKSGAGAKRMVTNPADLSQILGDIRDATPADVDHALSKALQAQPAWNALGGNARAIILEKAADLYEEHSSRLMAICTREAGKSLADARDEVREAVDFLRYYAACARAGFEGGTLLPGPTGERNEIRLHGRGVFAAIAPWNFPLAIFTGQISAALAAGNAVCAKPAEQTSLIAHEAVHLLHRAGVPADILHFLPGDGAVVGAALTGDVRLSGVVFTGSTETAKIIQRTLVEREGPIVPLIAETGGQNAMIVDSSALLEQVVDDAIASGFNSAGQRCSALRVLCVQEDVADQLIHMLTGAMKELVIGDPFERATDVGPVIDEEALNGLQAHITKMSRTATLLHACPMPDGLENGTFLPPHLFEISGFDQLEREVFGPIVHILRFKATKLNALCNAINETGYGLTLGIHSRIETTIAEIIHQARVGNIYVNRNQIGAVVGVQPFGGEGLSGTGPKAGGPDYLKAFATERVIATDTTAAGGNAALLNLSGDEF